MKKGTSVIVQGIITALLAAGNVILGIYALKTTRGEEYEVVDEDEFEKMKESGVLKDLKEKK